MVDVSEKQPSKRAAFAQAKIELQQTTIEMIEKGLVKKGDVFTVAQLAGIMAAKQTSNLIPLCHPIKLSHIDVRIKIGEDKNYLILHSEVHAVDKTGVEMEALTAVSIAALTIYDMIKAVDKGAVIREIVLLEKTGGKSGTFRRQAE